MTMANTFDEFDEDVENSQSQVSSGVAIVKDVGTEMASGESSTDDDDEQTASVRHIVSTWSEGTSIHGVPYALKYNDFRFWKRAFWGIMVVSFCGAMIYFIVSEVRNYQNYETEVSLSGTAPDHLPFPEVTVCNTNKYQKSRLSATGIDYPVNEDELLAVSQPLVEFFLTTKYQTSATDIVIVNPSDVWKPVITDFGLCWRFSTDELPEREYGWNVEEPGSDGGLEFSVFINQDEYQDTTTVAGVRVFITQPGTKVTNQLPFAFAKPTEFNFIYIQSVEHFRERDKPWSTCRGEAPEYTQPRCQALCRYDDLIENCDCRGLGDDRESLFLSVPLDYCPPIPACRSFARRACDCLPPPCHETVYTFQDTAVPLALNFDLGDTKSSLDEVIVQVNYDALRQTVSRETKKQTFSGLLGAIGGLMGLWAGISMISLLELFGELFAFRLTPRLWGDRRLYGLGARVNPVRKVV